MEKLIIDRSKWRTGHTAENATGQGFTALLNDQGFMCCLGFYSLACGYTEEEIRGVGEPQDIPALAGPTQDGFYVIDNRFPDAFLEVVGFEDPDPECQPPLEAREEGVEYFYDFDIKGDNSYDFIEVNDDTQMTREEREEEIIRRFKERLGVEVEFVGEYTDYEPPPPDNFDEPSVIGY